MKINKEYVEKYIKELDGKVINVDGFDGGMVFEIKGIMDDPDILGIFAFRLNVDTDYKNSFMYMPVIYLENYTEEQKKEEYNRQLNRLRELYQSQKNLKDKWKR